MFIGEWEAAGLFREFIQPFDTDIFIYTYYEYLSALDAKLFGFEVYLYLLITSILPCGL